MPKAENKTALKPVSSTAAGTLYSSLDVADLAGVSLRQLQWWDEQGVVSPQQEGHRRLYRREDAMEVAVIAELRRKGFSLQKIRKVVRFLQKEMGRGLAEAVGGASDIHLITDGKSIYLEDQADRVVDVLKNAKQPMFLVCVTDQWKRIEPVVTRKPARRAVTAGSAPSVLKTRVG